MATFDLTGSGMITLTGGTDRLFIDVTTLPAGVSTGIAFPTNYFHLGLLRVGVLGAFGPPIPIDGASIFIDLVAGADTLGYSLNPDAAIHVSETVHTPPVSGGLSLFPDDYVSSATPTTDFGGITIAMNFHVTASGYSVVAFRLYKPAEADWTTVTMKLWDGDGDTLLDTEAVTATAVGMNQFPVTPVPLNADTMYQINWTTVTNFFHIQETGALSGRTNGVLVAEQGYYNFGSGVLATSSVGPDWYGCDILVSTGA